MPNDKYELIVTEKPKVSQRVAEALADGPVTKTKYGSIFYYILERAGKKIVVAPAVGHVYTLKHKKGQTGFPIFDIEWIPSSEAHKGAAFTKPYVETLQFLGKNAESVVCACDYDIEGELIGYNVIKYCVGEEALKNAKRMKFSALTKEQLENAYDKKLDHLDFPLAEAGITRHMLDWYWGINTSRALSTAYKSVTGYYATLSAGRVQTPTLKVLDDREQEIKAFIPKPFIMLTAQVDIGEEALPAVHKTEKFFDLEEAEKIYLKCNEKPATVTELKKRKFEQKPPVPFNLGDMQIESHKLFKYTPKMTQSLAQSLYDAGLISYPRTSSQKLPEGVDPKKMLKKIAAQSGYKLLVDKILAMKSVKPNEGKKTDAAHPCIYPTGEIPKKVTPQEGKLYDLVVKRFLACFGEPAVRESQEIVFDIEEERFLAKGTITLEKNWHELYEPYIRLKEQELPELEQGKQHDVKQLDKENKETQPPNRYSQASIIKQMEKIGIGTKATRANILQTLYDRNYVQGTQIKVTEFGSKIIETLKKHVSILTSEELTREFEEYVEQIQEVKIEKETVLAQAKKTLTEVMEKFKLSATAVGEALGESYKNARTEQITLCSCPRCKTGNLMIRKSKASGKQFLGCSAYPKCDCSYPLPQFAKIVKTEKICEHDQLPIITVVRKAKRPFSMCIDPKCPSKADWGKKKVKGAPGRSGAGAKKKPAKKKTTKKKKEEKTE
ncbi:MAG: DNA topoisomerase I [Candidatus Undinarchaeales archaeon]|jgi:DNA topoisomerase-1|nr:DNA topoisomerase I [Candidatus Undinarchaeales archaeon]